MWIINHVRFPFYLVVRIFNKVILKILVDTVYKVYILPFVLIDWINTWFFPSAVGLEAESYMKAGKFVPDATMVKLISYELKRLDSVPWLLDGFPRNVSQAKMLTNISKVCFHWWIVICTDTVKGKISKNRR